MTRDEFVAWLKGWLARHPLRRPADEARASYTQEVMARVRAAQTPTPSFVWLPRPRLVFATASAVAAVCVVLVMVHRSPERLAARVDREVQFLTQLGEHPDEVADALLAQAPGRLEEELRTADQFMLAQASKSNDEDAWITQTLELLNSVGEGDDSGRSDDDATEQSLKDLDSQELASS